MKLGVVGFPSLYGGAGVELNDQLVVWQEMGIEVHIIPTGDPANEPLLKQTMLRAHIHAPLDYKALTGMPVISFCNDVFLRDIAKIKEFSPQTIFVNCMTWLFEAEKKAHKEGLIDLFLYQTARTQKKVGEVLQGINSTYNWKIFHSFADTRHLPFHDKRPTDKFRFGRVSREDADKYTPDMNWIYETMVSPVLKSGIILGFDKRSEGKTGKPPDYIRAYPGNGISMQEFYAHSSCIIQKTETFENWPRVGMEAMSSGSVLIVDDRGGWQDQVEHGVTGWLCKNSREFVYYASRMAYEASERSKFARSALERSKDLFSKEKSIKSWKEVLGC